MMFITKDRFLQKKIIYAMNVILGVKSLIFIKIFSLTEMGFLVVKIIWATSCTGQGARNLISHIADEVDADDAYVVCSSSF